MAIIKKRDTELEAYINKKYYTLFILMGITIFFAFTYKVLAVITGVIFLAKLNSSKLQMGIKGAEGESYARVILANLDDTYNVFCDVDVVVDGKVSQLDTIVVGDNGVFVIEVKNINGKVIGDIEDSDVIVEKIGRKGTRYTKSLYNPYKQVKTHVYRLSKYLKRII